MDYQAYISLTREQLLERLATLIKPKRLTHVLGVEETAIALAERFGADPVRAGLVGLLHDYAKEMPDQLFLDLIDKYQLDPDLKNWGNEIWHGLVGIYKIKEDLALTDPELLQAMAIHTVGSAQMTLLDKILYVADYIEPNRDFPGVEEARALAEQDLDKAVAFETARTLAHLASKGIPIYPQTLETYNAFVEHLTKD